MVRYRLSWCTQNVQKIRTRQGSQQDIIIYQYHNMACNCYCHCHCNHCVRSSPPSSRTRSSICRASHVHSAHVFGDTNGGVRILGPIPQTKKDWKDCRGLLQSNCLLPDLRRLATLKPRSNYTFSRHSPPLIPGLAGPVLLSRSRCVLVCLLVLSLQQR